MVAVGAAVSCFLALVLELLRGCSGRCCELFPCIGTCPPGGRIGPPKIQKALILAKFIRPHPKALGAVNRLREGCPVGLPACCSGRSRDKL